jgi:hypothetical protein
VVNEAGRSALRLMDARTLRALPTPELPAGIVSGVSFSPDNRRLGFTLNSSTAQAMCTPGSCAPAGSRVGRRAKPAAFRKARS